MSNLLSCQIKFCQKSIPAHELSISNCVPIVSALTVQLGFNARDTSWVLFYYCKVLVSIVKNTCMSQFSIIWKSKSLLLEICLLKFKIQTHPCIHIVHILYEHQLVKEVNEASNGHKRLAQENMQWYKDLSLLLHKKRIFSTLSWL